MKVCGINHTLHMNQPYSHRGHSGLPTSGIFLSFLGVVSLDIHSYNWQRQRPISWAIIPFLDSNL